MVEEKVRRNMPNGPVALLYKPCHLDCLLHKRNKPQCVKPLEVGFGTGAQT